MQIIFPLIFFIPKPKVAWRWLLLYGFISNFAQFAFMFSAIATGLATSLIALVVQSQAFFTVLIAVVASHEICDTLPRNLRHYNCRRFNGSASNLNTF
ncbi:hypothetical protein [Gallibacterium anatis]|uniref:hypothetical protein n=1 Tax=Gallibacterium anatis TaxID=750 RepID=UPI001B321BA9|nr:hypothetical protein [Gallibacterium anatis]MBP4133503.1 hypothetical protein [Gallibacterium anatis]